MRPIGSRGSVLTRAAIRRSSTPSQAGREAARKALALVGARPCKTGSYTLVLDREVAAALLSTVAQALSADAVQKGRSVFVGKLGAAIGSPLLTLVDDGLHPDGMATCPFDGEGVPQQTTTLLEGGVLRLVPARQPVRAQRGRRRSLHRERQAVVISRAASHRPQQSGGAAGRGHAGRPACAAWARGCMSRASPVCMRGSIP